MDNPVFVHVFSNGGYFVYSSLADTLLVRSLTLERPRFQTTENDRVRQLTHYVKKALFCSVI